MVRARRRIRAAVFAFAVGVVALWGVGAATAAMPGTQAGIADAGTSNAADASNASNASSVSNASDAKVTLTVTVVDQGGNPIPDARLSATWDGGGPVNETTASNGKAFVDVAEGTDVTITVDHTFYVRNEPYVVENASESDVRIQVARKGRAVVVVNDGDGRVANAAVRMFHDGRPVVVGRTGDDGTYTSAAIEQGQYTLITYKKGYFRNKSTVSVGSKSRHVTTIERGSVLVTFDVTDDHFDPPKPVANATVSVAGIGDVTTLSNGEATISVPVNAEYDVEITKPGYGTVSETLAIDESPATLNASIRRTPAIVAAAGTDRVVVGESVRVTVRDEYGTLVPNATVSLDGNEVGETNGNGVVTVPIESAGNHTISAAKNGLETSVVVEGVQPAPDETPTDTATVTPAQTTALTTTGPATTETSSSLGPGFGIASALVAILAVVALRSRRHRG